MEKIKICNWADIRKERWNSLLLGNGASIAIHNAFAYQTLHSVADQEKLLATTAPIFTELGTTDFEHVLLACWYAERVNGALGTPSTNISKAYAEVRKALIKAVHSVHPTHANVVEKLKLVGEFASKFPTVVSLNYDLTLYWAMLLFNKAKGTWFKDAFLNRQFETNWEHLRQPHAPTEGATLVFYPHGSLAIARDHLGNETKLATEGEGGLLSTITESWNSKHYVPVFVSEGASQKKVAAIHRSHYLTHVYEKVLPELGERLVVYGWSFDERDQHILTAIAAKPPRQIAVSVFTCQPGETQQVFCRQVSHVVCKSLPRTSVTFFHSQSRGCWNNPL
jgi:hypothetical protein